MGIPNTTHLQGITNRTLERNSPDGDLIGMRIQGISMSSENAPSPNGARRPTSTGVGHRTIEIVWHSSLGERRWTEHVFTEVRNARHVNISEWTPSEGIPSIHVVSTNDKQTK